MTPELVGISSDPYKANYCVLLVSKTIYVLKKQTKIMQKRYSRLFISYLFACSGNGPVEYMHAK